MMHTRLLTSALALMALLVAAPECQTMPPVTIQLAPSQPVYVNGELPSFTLTFANNSTAPLTLSTALPATIVEAIVFRDGKKIIADSYTVQLEQSQESLAPPTAPPELVTVAPHQSLQVAPSGLVISIPAPPLGDSRFHWLRAFPSAFDPSISQKLLVYDLAPPATYDVQLVYFYSGPDLGFSDVFHSKVLTTSARFEVR